MKVQAVLQPHAALRTAAVYLTLALEYLITNDDQARTACITYTLPADCQISQLTAKSALLL
jgi:hypothetical protein